jgi:hypothetical protein
MALLVGLVLLGGEDRGGQDLGELQGRGVA